MCSLIPFRAAMTINMAMMPHMPMEIGTKGINCRIAMYQEGRGIIGCPKTQMQNTGA